MAGKWDKYKDKLVKFQQPPDWQSEIDKVKESEEPQEFKIEARSLPGLRGLSTLDLTRELRNTRFFKDELEAVIKLLNTRLEAVQQLLLVQFEQQQQQSIKNQYGTFFQKQEPYSSVQDRVSFMDWVKEQKLEGMLSMPYQTMSALVKDRLEKALEKSRELASVIEAGEFDPELAEKADELMREAVPPGVAVFMKQSIQMRK